MLGLRGVSKDFVDRTNHMELRRLLRVIVDAKVGTVVRLFGSSVC
jgi:hypothetical protein